MSFLRLLPTMLQRWPARSGRAPSTGSSLPEAGHLAIAEGTRGKTLPHLEHPLLDVVRQLPVRLQPPCASGIGPRRHDAGGCLSGRWRLSLGHDVEALACAVGAQPVMDGAGVVGAPLAIVEGVLRLEAVGLAVMRLAPGPQLPQQIDPLVEERSPR